MTLIWSALSASTWMPVRFCGLNPSICMVTSYLATGSFGNEYSPCPSVVVVNIVPSVVFVAVTLTPGMTPPLGSLTIPERLPPTWAAAVVAKESARDDATANPRAIRIIPTIVRVRRIAATLKSF